MKAPFPAFGGKSVIAPVVWERFGGNLDNYVEPFVNSAAVALAAPYIPKHETWNDLNGHIANFWRATAADPDAVAAAADWPISEADLHARHAWLVRRQADMTDRLMGDPDWYHTKIAGWWLWGICQWIGTGWCSGVGPWQADDTGRLRNTRNEPQPGAAGGGVKRQMPALSGHKGINSMPPGTAGGGVKRKMPHLGDRGRGINRVLPGAANGGGVKRNLPHLGDRGRGINRVLPGEANGGTCEAWSEHLRDMMRALRDRLRRVRVCCGDWTRVLGPSPTVQLGTTGVYLDPPYQLEGRDAVYDSFDAHPNGDNANVFYAVRDWAVANGHDPRLRIAVSGYHENGAFPADWIEVRWKAHGGYGNHSNGAGRANTERECIWFSPHCINPEQDARSAMLRPIAVAEGDYTGTLFD